MSTSITRIACFDKPGTIDRFTVAYLDERHGKYVACLGMSEHPSHPQGFGQHSECLVGNHLGRKIRFDELPTECQAAVRLDCEGQTIEDTHV